MYRPLLTRSLQTRTAKAINDETRAIQRPIFWENAQWTDAEKYAIGSYSRR